MMDAHIRSFHETYDLTIKDVKTLLKKAFNGDIKNISEKIDGQSFNVIIINGSPMYIGKSLSTQRLSKQELLTKLLQNERTNRKESLIASYMQAFDSMIDFVKQNNIKNGTIIKSDIVNCLTANIIKYNKNVIYLHNIKTNSTKCHDYEIISTPSSQVKHIINVDITNSIVEDEFSNLHKLQEHSEQITIGKLCSLLIINELRLLEKFNDNSITQEKIAYRLLHKNTQFIKKHELSFNDKLTLEQLENDRTLIVNNALLPLEMTIQNITSKIIEVYDIVCENDKNVSDIKTKITEIDNAFRQNRMLFKNEREQKSMGIALKRINIDKFNRNTEGFVFPVNNNVVKISGFYPVVNRILGFVTFNDAKIVS